MLLIMILLCIYLYFLWYKIIDMKFQKLGISSISKHNRKKSEI
jgi:hypothetical protein